MAKHADNDALNLIHESVPPADLSKVAIFRAALAKYEKQAGLTAFGIHFLGSWLSFIPIQVEDHRQAADEKPLDLAF